MSVRSAGNFYGYSVDAFAALELIDPIVALMAGVFGADNRLDTAVNNCLASKNTIISWEEHAQGANYDQLVWDLNHGR